MEYIKIENEVKNILSEKRFIHSKNVVQRAVELAKIYGLDEDIVKKVAITHDIAKELNLEEANLYIEKNNIYLDEIEKSTPALLHAKIGAHMVKEKYNFSIKMQNAIKYHTIGNVGMDDLAKIIFIADKTEKGRNHINIEEAVKIAKENLDLGVLYVAKDSVEYSFKKNSLIHIDTINLINSIIKKKF